MTDGDHGGAICREPDTQCSPNASTATRYDHDLPRENVSYAAHFPSLLMPPVSVPARSTAVARAGDSAKAAGKTSVSGVAILSAIE